MSTDARLSTGLPAHPKTKKLIRRCGEAGAWHLVVLILWARANRPDGDLDGMTGEDIELAVDWRGEPDAFVAALADVGFLEGAEGAFRLHDWAEHQPWAAGSEARSEKARWAALVRRHGRDEASRQMPEYAAKLATSSGSAASGTDSPATSRNGAAKSPAPSPNPSPSPSPKQEPPIPPCGGLLGDDDPKPKRKRAATGKITFTAFTAECREAGEKPIPADHPVFAFARDTGIPVEFIRLAWREFARKYRDGKTKQLGRAGWRQKFNNCVRENWYRLWWLNTEGVCELTTTGRILQKELDAEAREAA